MTKTTVRGEQITDATVSLTADVKDVLPVANGGTGQASLSGLALTSPALSGTATGTYTLGGTPTINNLALVDPGFNPNGYIKDYQGATVLALGSPGSAVNNLQINNAAAGNQPTIFGVGSDADVPIRLWPQGAANVQVVNGLQINSSDTVITRSAAGQIAVAGVDLLMLTATQSPTNKTLNNTNTVNTWACAPNVLSTSQTVTANCGAYIPDSLEMAAGIACEVGAGSTLEVG